MKNSYLVDTNVILRFLLEDDLEQQKQAADWFNQAEQNKIELYIQPIVVAESCFVLESYYKLSRQKIASTFEVLLSQRWLHVSDRNTLTAMWPHYVKGLHFVDSFLLSKVQLENLELLTFDNQLSASR